MDVSKARFYAGRIGGRPAEVFMISACSHVAIFWISYISKILFRKQSLRIAFELIAIPSVLFWFVFWPSLWHLSVFLPLVRFPEFERGSGRDVPLAFARFTVLFLTTVCIIAVDFPSFPARHAKTSRDFFVFGRSLILSGGFRFENVSLSLMDTGASYFVIINGWGRVSFRRCLWKAMINFVLWGARLVLTESTNYFTPEGEYSANCNFFGYIGGVHLVAALLSLTGVRAELLCVFWSGVHELTGNRVPFLGYVALFYLAHVMGFRLSNSSRLWQWCAYLMPIVLCELGILHPVREDHNIAFCLFCFSSLYLVVVIAKSFPIRYSEMTSLYRAIDQHALVFFGLSNLATGAVNLSIDTNHSSLLAAFLAVAVVFASSWLGTLVIALIRTRSRDAECLDRAHPNRKAAKISGPNVPHDVASDETVQRSFSCAGESFENARTRNRIFRWPITRDGRQGRRRQEAAGWLPRMKECIVMDWGYRDAQISTDGAPGGARSSRRVIA
jgi:hypothetical protein